MSDPHLDDVLAILSHQPQRMILTALLDQPAGLALAEMVAEIEDTGTGQIQLVHRYLPKLDTRDYVEWESTEGRIQRGAKWEDIEPVVELLRSHQVELPGRWV